MFLLACTNKLQCVHCCFFPEKGNVMHGNTVHFFADANPLFALTPAPTNQPLRNDYVIIVYGTCNNVNGGTRNNLHVLSSQMAESTRCDALRQCSCVAVLSTLSERYINKHLTRSKHKQQVTAGIKLRTLDAFCKCI